MAVKTLSLASSGWIGNGKGLARTEVEEELLLRSSRVSMEWTGV